MAINPGSPIAYFSRRYHFSASHRLHTEAYDAEQNRTVFGKCNNPYGHGHNYMVQVTLRGPIDDTTGMVCDMAALDAFARSCLLDGFDHVNLNTLECFADTPSTTENLAIELHRVFAQFEGATLDRIHVEETRNNSFDFYGDGQSNLPRRRAS